METKKVIEQYILNYLLSDSELTTLMGNTNIRVGTLLRSDYPPYIRFDLESAIKDPGDSIAMKGTLTMDLWDYTEEGTETISNVLERVIQLLDYKTFANHEKASGIRVYYDTDMRVPDEEEFVYHYVIIFSVEYIRTNVTNVM